MATVVYKNAVLLVNGADLSGSVVELAVSYGCEVLDATAMGNSTRLHKGGLLTAQISGRVWYESGAGLSASVLWPLVGVDDTVLTVYPNGVTVGVGPGTAGYGFACKGVLSQFNVGGAVGTLLPIQFTIEARGIEA